MEFHVKTFLWFFLWFFCVFFVIRGFYCTGTISVYVLSKGEKKMEIYGSDIRGVPPWRGVLERVEVSYNPNLSIVEMKERLSSLVWGRPMKKGETLIWL